MCILINDVSNYIYTLIRINKSDWYAGAVKYSNWYNYYDDNDNLTLLGWLKLSEPNDNWE